MDRVQIERLDLTRSEMLVVRELMSTMFAEIARLHPDPGAKLAEIEVREASISYDAATQTEQISEQQAKLWQEKLRFRKAVFDGARRLLPL